MTPRPLLRVRGLISRLTRNLGRTLAIALGLALLAAACGSGDSDDPTLGSGSEAESDSDAEAVAVDQIPGSPDADVPSALDNMNNDAFPKPLIDPDRVISGGPPPDGIPSIDSPKFLNVDDVDFLEDDEPVLALQVGDEARAYPLQIMIWHEIANDTIGDVPVTVSYCPLCNTAIAYVRRLDDQVLDFGTSGRLFNSALVMYDRQTESLWSHFTGEAVIGHLTGAQLELLPVATISWTEFRDAHPDGLVLSRDTGHSRSYGSNPYPGYDSIDSPAFLFDGEVDGRLAAKEKVVGIERNGDAVAIVHSKLSDDGVVEFQAGGDNLVAWLEPGTATALEAGSVAGGRDVGASGVFVPVVDGQRLTFTSAENGFVDNETGSRWNVLGRAVEGPLKGVELKPVVHVDTFWFAWGAFQPESQIIN